MFVSDTFSDDGNSMLDNKEKPSQDKISLIFDLDETFITRIDSGLYAPVHTSLGPHRLITINYKYTMGKHTSDETEIIAIRPGFVQFKQFLLSNLKHFNIGFWSTGIYTRVKAVVDTLFPELVKNKQVTVLIGRDDKDFPVNGYVKARDTGNGNWFKDKFQNRVFYDLLTHKHLKFDGYLNGNIVKRVALLCDLPDYRDILHKKRTILVDDLTNNVIVNDSYNTIWVNEWGYNFTCDDTLPKLQKWLDKHKQRKSFEKVKMPNYARDSKFDKVFTHNSIEYATASQKVCDDFYKKGDSQKRASVSKAKKSMQRNLKAKKGVSISQKVSNGHKHITHKQKKRISSSKTKKRKGGNSKAKKN